VTPHHLIEVPRTRRTGSSGESFLQQRSEGTEGNRAIRQDGPSMGNRNLTVRNAAWRGRLALRGLVAAQKQARDRPGKHVNPLFHHLVVSSDARCPTAKDSAGNGNHGDRSERRTEHLFVMVQPTSAELGKGHGLETQRGGGTDGELGIDLSGELAGGFSVGPTRGRRRWPFS
jgi:hypothetical protein